MELLKDTTFVNSEGEEVEAQLDGKIIGLYFSASWCPPCRQFTPVLRDFYEELQHRKCPFELIFVTLDKTEREMMEYMRTMHGDWLAVPFADPLISALRDKLDVQLVPRLVVFQPDGVVITTTGRKEIQDKGVAAFRFWQDAAARSSTHVRTTQPAPTEKPALQV